MEPNFSGYVSKANLQCADGRTIMPNAFQHQDGMRVPVVYQHNHTDVNQVLGYAVLKNKEDGMWGDVFLNSENPSSIAADNLVKQGALNKFSVWAKNLVERGEFVHSGDIQEVSLVLSGANSGASVYNVLMHGNVDPDEMMYVGGEIVHADLAEKKAEDAPPVKDESASEKTEDEGEKTIAEVLDTLNDEQKLAVNATIDDIVTEAVTEALTEKGSELEHDNLTQKGTQMHKNAFEEGQAVGGAGSSAPQLNHDDMVAILSTAKGSPGDLTGFNDGQATGSLKDLVRSKAGRELMHADTYGIDNMEIMFPDAQALMATPTFVDRRQDWVKAWMAGTSHTPFSRVKTFHADITADEARAKGYIKGNMKTEEVFPVFKRSTGPGWIIKKQRLDRQDIIDVKSFDVVAWMKVEMRGKLDEEVARAGLFGDGRPTMIGGELNPDKIQEPTGTSGDGIRSVVNDHELYTSTYFIPLDASAKGQAWNVLLDGVTEAGEDYMGGGNKTAFMSFRTATRLLTIRDDWGKRIYRNLSEVAGDMDVARIQRVPTDLFPADVLCIVLDLADYNYGTDRGGEVTLFDDFDINFNQYHYLIETYLSGALTMVHSAQVFKRVDADDDLVVPAKPAFNETTNVITIPSTTGAVYKRTDTGATLAAASTLTLDDSTLPIVEIEASAASGYYITTNDDRHDSWTFEYQPPA